MYGKVYHIYDIGWSRFIAVVFSETREVVVTKWYTTKQAANSWLEWKLGE